MRIFRYAVVIMALSLAVALPLVGCANGTDRAAAPSTQQNVSDVLQEKTQQDAKSASASNKFVGDEAPAFDRVDFDLTAMNAEMVYATVNDMMMNPAQYEGKTIRMEGPYYHTRYEDSGNDYFFVIIQDATACCAQGIEFIWGDGSHVFPDEYPPDEQEVVVTGKFEIYTEGSDKYAHLVDASLQDATA